MAFTLDRTQLLLALLSVFVFLFIRLSHSMPPPPSSNSKNLFRRVPGESVQSTRCSQHCRQTDFLPSLRNRHRCLYARGRLYFLSLKGKRQPTFGSYHETALYGGYLSTYFVGDSNSNGSASMRDAPSVVGSNRAESIAVVDGGGSGSNSESSINYSSSSSSSIWTHSHFDPIDKQENREDAFFAVNGHVFLLIYSRFENITFRDLLWWRHGSPSAWTPISILDSVDQPGSHLFTDGNIQNGALAWTVHERSVYFLATDGWGRIAVYKLEIRFADAGGTSSTPTTSIPVSSELTVLASDAASPVTSGGAVVAMTNFDGNLYAFYGLQGCSFHWEKRRLIVVRLNTTTSDYWLEYLNLTTSIVDEQSSTIPADEPPWAFNGPTTTETRDGRWYMFGGSVAAGVSSTEFDPRIWSFELRNLRWRKIKRTRVPEQLNPYEMCSAVDPETGLVYLADFRHIFKAPLDML